MRAYMSSKARKDMRDPATARALVSAGIEASKTGEPKSITVNGRQFTVTQATMDKKEK